MSLSTGVGATLGPNVGDRAAGHGVSGTIASVPQCQPLAGDGIWRVALAGEAFGRLVRRCDHAFNGRQWQLLQMDEITDEQLDAYEAAMQDQTERGSASSF